MSDRRASAFATDGYVVVRGLLDPDGCAAATAYRDALVSRLGLPPTTPLVAAPAGDTFLDALASGRRLAGLAGALLGAPVSCFGATYLDKAAGAGLPAAWHQDIGPWEARLGGAAALTIWLALTDADEENGCLRVVPGSHGLSAQPLARDGGRSLFGVAMDAALVAEDRAVSLCVRAGDAVVHHPNLVHASLENRSARRRLALALRYRTAGPVGSTATSA